MRKSLLLCSFFLALLLAGVPSKAQPSLGFTNLSGFPDFIVQGTQYNLSGWIVNRGNAAFTGTVDVKMELNAQNVLPVSNNFQISTPLQPGDSVYWTDNNHNFPNGQLRLGNNDVLIWPTVPTQSSVEADTLGEVWYYAEAAAFRLMEAGFTVLGDGFLLDKEYSFTCHATNVGASQNIKNVQLFAQLEGYDPYLVTETAGNYIVGQDVEFSIVDFNVVNAFSLPEDISIIGSVTFYALEEEVEFEPLNMVNVNIISQAVGVADPNAATLMAYPNPCTDFLKIALPMDWDAATATVSDMAGRQLLSQSLTGNRLDVSLLPSGTYLLEVQSELGRLHQAFIRQ